MWNLSKVRLMKIAKDPPYVIEAKKKGKGKEKKHTLVETITSGNRQLFWCFVAMLNLSITSVSAHTNTGNKNRK